MIQDQLVDYIASQIKLGVPRDSVKTALIGVGWSAQDVEDTLKKVEGGTTPAAAPASAPVSMQSQAQSQIQKPAAVAAKSPASPNIRVSDLVSASLTPTVLSSRPSTGPAQKFSPASMTQGKMNLSPAMGDASKKPMGKSAFVMIGLILILAGVSAYLYFQNSSLNSQLQAAGGQAPAQGAAAAQVTTLTGQVQALTASSTALTAQIADLTAQIASLQADLSFLVVPVGQPAGTPVSVTVSGALSGGKTGYFVTTPEGVKITVKNSANADVQAALQPLTVIPGVTVQISGTHNPGSASVTVIDVNGQPVTKPAVASSTTTTATTTPTSTGQ